MSFQAQFDKDKCVVCKARMRQVGKGKMVCKTCENNWFDFNENAQTT